MNPFDFVNAITFGKNDIMIESEDYDQAVKDYNPFMVNRALSYYPDTVAYANALNEHSYVGKREQFLFLINIVRKKKRFSKWTKKKNDADLDAIIEYFGLSADKARAARRVLNEEQLSAIRKKIEKGGST